MGDDSATRRLGKLDLAATLPHSGDVLDELPFGQTIGRYLVLGVLGRGGMGIVYEAYDPVLDRRIAVKLLREVVDDDASAGRARMQREAQALARLSHPSVITVHDVSEHDGAMYIAMELVRGTTLHRWQARRGWREVVGAYSAAARGLGAAHAAGLVHRDFKPANVFIDASGRARVGDFGLVGRADAAGPASVRPEVDSPLHADITETGMERAVDLR
ncbi:MAG TPA: serine/threonine-protein kinase, partial [Kofleriaceae bacterium]|nr:serine/threonine-protein kinase [Kofleriaceae bacterium]